MSDDEAIEYSETELLEEESGERAAEAPRAVDGLVPGVVIEGRYEILDVVGEGGMGRVFKAEDMTLHEMVALKTLNVETAENPDAVRQFHREVKLARRVAHPHVIRTYDIGTTDAYPFLTMEYLQGEDLRRAIRAGEMSASEVVSTAGDIADGLAAAHEVGVLHRDLKPENVLIGEAGRVALTDFGIAGAVRSGDGRETIRQQAVGTPAYMAPEQVRGDTDMDQRVDIYAFGILLFEMVTGRLPWEADDPMSLAIARIDAPAPSVVEYASGIPGGLADAIDACLSRAPGERPSDFDRVREMLESVTLAPAASPMGRPAVAGEGPESPGDSESQETEPWAETRPSSEALRVVVLPFEHDDAESAVDIASGLRQDLIYRLGHWERVEVRLREKPREVSVSGQSARRVGRRFDADVVVGGEIRDADGAWRVSTTLVSVVSGDRLWSDVSTFETDDANDVAAEMADEIGFELTNSAPETSPQRLPTLAHSLLKEGSQILRKRWRTDVTEAVERLEEAREHAPNHPRVLSQLAIARSRRDFLYPDQSEERDRKPVDLAREAIDRAGDQWAEPRYALAMAHFYERSYGSAVATLRAALERDPNFAEAHELLGRIQAELGPLERSVEHLERALELNPYLYRTVPDLMRVYGFEGRWSGVDELAERPPGTDYQQRAHFLTALRLSFWNDRPALRRTLEATRQTFDLLPEEERWVPFELAFEVLETGELPDGWERELAEPIAALPDSRMKTLMHQCATEAAAYACEPEAALEFLDGAIDAGLTDLVWLRYCPVFDDYRDRPEFIRRFERIRGRVEALEFA